MSFFLIWKLDLRTVVSGMGALLAWDGRADANGAPRAPQTAAPGAVDRRPPRAQTPAMDLLARIVALGHEQVIAFQDPPSGLRGFLAIHSTRLGPALGGVRRLAYPDEAAALADVLRLSRAMTYKCALAGLPAGGGKAVLMDHPGFDRARAFEAYGRIVEAQGGRFFTGGDVGIAAADLDAVGRATRHVACETAPGLGDVNLHTALGVWHGMRACLAFAGLAPAGARVAIQGAGNVGAALARILRREGCTVTLADVDEARARRVAGETGAGVVAPDGILSADCDVLAPCALGGVLDARSVPALRARIVCGAANNQLATPEDGAALARRGILYAPDYLVNAGGVIRGAEYPLLHLADSLPSLERIHDRMLAVARAAAGRGLPTARVADDMAEARLNGVAA